MTGENVLKALLLPKPPYAEISKKLSEVSGMSVKVVSAKLDDDGNPVLGLSVKLNEPADAVSFRIGHDGRLWERVGRWWLIAEYYQDEIAIDRWENEGGR